MDTHIKLEKLYQLIQKDKNQPKVVIEKPSAKILRYKKDQNNNNLYRSKTPKNIFESTLNKVILKALLKKFKYENVTIRKKEKDSESKK